MDNYTIKDLFLGKPTVIKTKEFLPTRNYVEPFLNRMSAFTNDFRIQVKTPDQVTKTDEIKDITFNRVLIQAVLPEQHDIDGHQEVIGFLYGIDVKKPVAKLYRGYLNSACTNLCVFSPSWLNIQDLIPDEPINLNPLQELMERENDFLIYLERLKSTILDRELRTSYLGKWVDYALRESQDYGFGKVKIAVSTPVDAYTQLFIDAESEYYIPEGVDPTLYDVFNSFTQIITDDKRDILNKFEKTMIINKLLEIW